MAADRAAGGRRSVGGDPARRRRHRHADRHVRDGKFVLSHFSGARPLRLELTPQPDGTLAVVQNNDKPLTATARRSRRRAKGLPRAERSVALHQRQGSDRAVPFQLSRSRRQVVSNTDPRFRGKVVIVSIGGSWCPNCHDEAPFLVELYKKYRETGLEIVELSFEEEAQIKNPVRAARVQQTVRRRLHRADPRRAERAERQGAAGGEPQLVPDHVLPRARRPRPQRARRLCRARRAASSTRSEGRSRRRWSSACSRRSRLRAIRGASDRSADTRIGAVHLTISDLRRSVRFYETHLGFAVHRRDDRTAWLGAGGADLLVLSQCERAPRVRGTTGLYHFAILVPSRADLARALRRLVATDTVMQGAADHGVSEALYLADPDGNGIEIYRDRPRDEWPIVDGQLRMGADPLDFDGAACREPGRDGRGARRRRTVIGHVHLHVSRLDDAERFYVDVLGFELMQRYGPSALFVSAGGYHHHIGLNTWAGVGAPPPPPGAIGLRHFARQLPTRRRASGRRTRARRRHHAGTTDDGPLVHDPAKNAVLLRTERLRLMLKARAKPRALASDLRAHSSQSLVPYRLSAAILRRMRASIASFSSPRCRARAPRRRTARAGAGLRPRHQQRPHRRRHRQPVVPRRRRRARRHDRRASRRGSTRRRRASIDAAGKVVAPGFIDIHTHARRGIFEVPTADNYVRQGVTTLIEGPDGSSPLPIKPFLDRVAALAGHAELRPVRRPGHRCAMQVIGPVNRKATADELEKMRGLVRQGMRGRRVRPELGSVLRARHVHADRRSRSSSRRSPGRMGGIYISHMRDEAARRPRQRPARRSRSARRAACRRRSRTTRSSARRTGARASTR